jgi:acetylxylan esterase
MKMSHDLSSLQLSGSQANYVRPCAALSLGLFLASLALFATPSYARAAPLSGPVSGWGSGVPSYISMYEYVPAKLVASPPIVVAAHYCGGSASAFFSAASSIVAAADKYGFIMIFPQTTNPATSAKCWDVGSKASLTHDGGGDTQAIAQMVEYEIGKRDADPGRVYVMGASSGAMLTEAMLAVYPDVFKAGAEFSGVPAGCWSAGWSAASNWGGTCASGKESQTPEQWGDLVRGMYPGYAGYRPRVQLWHGTADTTINFNNQTEAIKEWTNVLGVPMTPTSTDSMSVPGFKIEKWQSACGFTVLEAHTENNGGHTTPIDGNAVVSFFGLDKSGSDPQIAACGNSGGMAGSSGGATAGSGGGAMAGSSGAMQGGSSGAMSGNSGASGAIAGSSSGTAGSTSARPDNSGVMAGGVGGGVDMGLTRTAGIGSPNTAGRVAINTPGVAGSSGNIPSSEPTTERDTSGCSCALDSRYDPSSRTTALTLTVCALLFFRRRRGRRSRLSASECA